MHSENLNSGPQQDVKTSQQPQKSNHSLFKIQEMLLGAQEMVFGTKEIPFSSLEDNYHTRVNYFLTRANGSLNSFSRYQDFLDPVSKGNIDHNNVRNLQKKIIEGKEYFNRIINNKDSKVNKDDFTKELKKYESYIEYFVEMNSSFQPFFDDKTHKEMKPIKIWVDAPERQDQHKVEPVETQKRSHIQEQPSRSSKKDRSQERFLFSEEQTKRAIAEEKIITEKYHALFKGEGVKKPELFELAVEIVKDTNPPDEQLNTTYLLHLQLVNKQLHEHAESLAKDVTNRSENRETDSQHLVQRHEHSEQLDPFQLALRDTISKTRTCHDWFTDTWIGKYSKWFDFNEPWFKEGLQTLGLKVDDVKQSHEALLANEEARTIITTSAVPANDFARNYSPENMVQTWEKLTRANAHLDYIQSELSKGFPVEPSVIIRGQVEKIVSGEDYNCLPISWLEDTGWNRGKKEEEAKVIRGVIIKRMQDRLTQLNQTNTLLHRVLSNIPSELHTDEREALQIRLAELKEPKAMLDQGAYEGRILIDYLAQRGLIDRRRGLLIYRFVDGNRMSFTESDIMPIDPEFHEPPYALTLRQDDHFNPMVDVENFSGKPETLQGVIHRMSEMSSISDIYKKDENKKDLEDALQNKDILMENYLSAFGTASALAEWGTTGDIKNQTEKDFIMDQCKQQIKLFEEVDAAMPLDIRVSAREEVLKPTHQIIVDR